jgi:rubrerythrin
MTANPLEMEDFDFDRYLRASKRVDLSGVAWERVRTHPVLESEARCLAYMMDIETHTSIYLRDLLATRAAYEPDITAFLSCWVYEELWHGEAFSRFLGEAGWELAPDLERVTADSAYPSRLPRNQGIRRRLGGKGRLSHVGTMLGSALMEDFVALHMTWAPPMRLSTLTSYRRLIARTQHPELINLLNAIIKDERRHFAFYRAQARLRLARSAAARRITRWAMDHLWAIVGTDVRPQVETDFVVVELSVIARAARRRSRWTGRSANCPGWVVARSSAEREPRRGSGPTGSRFAHPTCGLRSPLASASAAGPSSPPACP